MARKEARKQERAARKQNKAEFFSTNAARYKRPAAEDYEESPQRKRAKHDKSLISATSGAPQSLAPKKSKEDVPVKPLPPSILKTSKKARTALEKLAGGPNTIQAPTVQTRKEEEEDSYIAYLESKLGYAKGKKKKIVEDDGLNGKSKDTFCRTLVIDFNQTCWIWRPPSLNPPNMYTSNLPCRSTY